MSTAPQPEFKSAQFEFTDEHNRTLSGLSASMSTSATLLQLLLVPLVVLALRTGKVRPVVVTTVTAAVAWFVMGMPQSGEREASNGRSGARDVVQ